MFDTTKFSNTIFDKEKFHNAMFDIMKFDMRSSAYVIAKTLVVKS
jgi:hypothetical protein